MMEPGTPGFTSVIMCPTMAHPAFCNTCFDTYEKTLNDPQPRDVVLDGTVHTMFDSPNPPKQPACPSCRTTLTSLTKESVILWRDLRGVGAQALSQHGSL